MCVRLGRDSVRNVGFNSIGGPNPSDITPMGGNIMFDLINALIEKAQANYTVSLGWQKKATPEPRHLGFYLPWIKARDVLEAAIKSAVDDFIAELDKINKAE
jgi:hypothetical protein